MHVNRNVAYTSCYIHIIFVLLITFWDVNLAQVFWTQVLSGAGNCAQITWRGGGGQNHGPVIEILPGSSGGG